MSGARNPKDHPAERPLTSEEVQVRRIVRRRGRCTVNQGDLLRVRRSTLTAAGVVPTAVCDSVGLIEMDGTARVCWT